MLTLGATTNHVVLHFSIYACVMSQMFLFYFIFYGGALVFLGGAGAPASPSLAPPMPKGILGWESGAERIERAEGSLLWRKYDRSAPAPLHSTHMICWTLIYNTFIHQEEQLIPCVILHYAIFTSLHMRSTFQFRFSIRSSVYMSSGSDYKRNKPPLTIRSKF